MIKGFAADFKVALLKAASKEELDILDRKLINRNEFDSIQKDIKQINRTATTI